MQIRVSKRLKLYCLSILFFATIFGVIFALVELGLRHLYAGNGDETRDHLVQADYMPAKMKANYRGQIWGVPFRTNRFGLRDEEDFSETAPAGEYRILSLGDSIAFGLGLPASSHYTKLLEKKLNEAETSTRVRVINAAGPGYSPSGYYLYLRNEGLRLDPRLVIIEIELCNDVTDEALLRWEVESGELKRVRGGRYIVGWDGNLLATYCRGPYFFERTYTYTVLTRRLLNLLYRIDPTEPFAATQGVTYYSLGFDRYLLDTERIEEGWTRLFGAIEQTRDLLKREGVDFLLVIMPTQYMFDPATGPYGAFAEKLVKRAIEEARRRDLPFIDMTEPIRDGGGKSLYFDFAHPTAEGNKVIAKELFHRLSQVQR
ncbi:MAG TPA: SGNH/GDSL hydrolase family protein [Acidobacteriota bacterium]|nr:SGNH/GDSL hydrolase family protein [Acidobacteriota bacterium]